MLLDVAMLLASIWMLFVYAYTYWGYVLGLTGAQRDIKCTLTNTSLTPPIKAIESVERLRLGIRPAVHLEDNRIINTRTLVGISSGEECELKA